MSIYGVGLCGEELRDDSLVAKNSLNFIKTKLLINSFNPVPHYPDFKCPLERGLLKKLWEMKKMLVSSIILLNPLGFQHYH